MPSLRMVLGGSDVRHPARGSEPFRELQIADPYVGFIHTARACTRGGDVRAGTALIGSGVTHPVHRQALIFPKEILPAVETAARPRGAAGGVWRGSGSATEWIIIDRPRFAGIACVSCAKTD